MGKYVIYKCGKLRVKNSFNFKIVLIYISVG